VTPLRNPHDAEIGAPLAGRPLRLSLARVLAFSGGPLDEPGWPQRNLHTDIDKAREAGLDHIIASGTQSEGLLIAFLIETFGCAWYRSGNLEVRFLKPVRVGDVVRPGLRWTGKEPVADGLRLMAECWCEIDDGSRVIAGTASCALPIPHDGASRA
jgi:MaoC dehydratase-like protein